jgi:hypothetical protein
MLGILKMDGERIWVVRRKVERIQNGDLILLKIGKFQGI